MNQFNRERHGGLYDRGSADSYYRHTPDPHWYPEGTARCPGYGTRKVDLTLEEIAEYYEGYNDNQSSVCCPPIKCSINTHSTCGFNDCHSIERRL